MPIKPDDLLTGGALQGAVAASLLRQHESDAELAPGDVVGVFRILREIGRGGMAIVYLAERADDEYRQQVALKWVRAVRTDGVAAALFLRERQALADLRHPHIARLLDGGRTAEGRPWFAMEYIDGEFLDRHCRHHRLPLERRLGLFLQVCSAAAYAHARGVLHRDIKPGNVLVDSDGAVRLLDFGIAWLAGQDDLAANAHTPGFASPEQVRGESLTVASDVFQLGGLLASLIDDRTEPASTVAPTVPVEAPVVSAALDGMRLDVSPENADRDLQAIIQRACASDPAQRYATADALAADVRARIEHRPVAARAHTPAYVIGRFVRRHAIASLVGAMTLMIVVAGSIYFMVRLKSERDAAAYQARVATSVLDFLRDDLLAAASPEVGLGREITVREALDVAAENVGHRFADAVAEQGAIRTTLAHLYARLGRLEQAEAQAHQAVQLAANGGVATEGRLDAQFALINILLGRGRNDEAERLVHALLEQWRTLHVPVDRNALRAQSLLAWIRREAGAYDEAAHAHARVAEQAEALFGASDMLTLDSRLSRAEALQMSGEHAQALALMLPVHDHLRESLGERHPKTLTAAHSIGVLKRHQGLFAESADWLHDTLRTRRLVLGDKHPETLQTINELATALQDQKRYDEAESLFREALETRLAVLGEAHRYTRGSMSNLGLLYSLWGKPELAAPLYEQALSIDRRLDGENHPDTLASMHNLAGLYRTQSRFDEALALHADVIARAQGHPDLGPDAWQTGLFRIGLARSLKAAGRVTEAVAEMDRAIAVLETSYGADHPRTQRARAIRSEFLDN